MDFSKALHLKVNLAGRHAGNNPGQSQKNLWVRHTNRKVVQVQQISRVKKGKVMEQVAGEKEAVNVMIHKLSLYRQVRMDMLEPEVMANPGCSHDQEGQCGQAVNKHKFK